MTIGDAFNRSIDYYDAWITKALPNFGDIFQTALDLIPFEPAAPLKVLDLGAGTGMFSKHVMGKYPQAHFVLYDLAEKMLGVAKERFRNRTDQFEYITGDYREMPTDRAYNLVVSSLSIHHLEDADKAALFKRIYQVLRPGGLFINIDQIKGETPYLRDLYWNHWLEQVRAAGFAEERIQESIDRRVPYDRDALLADQLAWLKEAGFVNVDCVYKNFFVGVFLGMKG